jgi:hypothetical protein
MAETVAGINLIGDATYDRELMVDANLKTMVRAMIRNARVVKETQSQFTDGSIWAEVTLGMLLFGENGLIQPSMQWQASQTAQPTPAPAPVHTNAAPAPVEDTIYTGLIIDAIGMGANPAMLPKIMAENGRVIFGTGKIDRNYVIKYGLMGYQRDLTNAKRLDRVGGNPLVVSPVSISGKNRADFVVSQADADRILAASSRAGFSQPVPGGGYLELIRQGHPLPCR